MVAVSHDSSHHIFEVLSGAYPTGSAGLHFGIDPTFRTRGVLDPNLAVFQLNLQILRQYLVNIAQDLSNSDQNSDKSEMECSGAECGIDPPSKFIGDRIRPVGYFEIWVKLTLTPS